MSENRRKQTNFILTVCVAIILTFTVGTITFYFELGPFSRKPEVAKAIYPVDMSEFFFEVNDGIFDGKAVNTMIKAMSVKDGTININVEYQKRLEDALASYKVTLTRYTGVGLVYAIASWLNDNKAMVDAIISLKLHENLDRKAMCFFNIIKEMACHINLQEHCGNICVSAYDDSFFSNVLHTEKTSPYLGQIEQNSDKVGIEYNLVTKHVTALKDNEHAKKIFDAFEKYLISNKIWQNVRSSISATMNDSQRKQEETFITRMEIFDAALDTLLEKMKKLHTYDITQAESDKLSNDVCIAYKNAIECYPSALEADDDFTDACNNCDQDDDNLTNEGAILRREKTLRAKIVQSRKAWIEIAKFHNHYSKELSKKQTEIIMKKTNFRFGKLN